MMGVIRSQSSWGGIRWRTYFILKFAVESAVFEALSVAAGYYQTLDDFLSVTKWSACIALWAMETAFCNQRSLISAQLTTKRPKVQNSWRWL